MSWEYRVVKRSILTPEGDLERWLEIMGIQGNNTYRVYFSGDNKNDLIGDIKAYSKALDLPVLEEKDGKLVEVEE